MCKKQSHLIPAVNAQYTTVRPIATQFPGHGCLDDLTTERSFNSQATCVVDVLGLFFDMLSMGFCTTGHWQTSGRLVQELNIRTVPYRWDWCFITLNIQTPAWHAHRVASLEERCCIFDWNYFTPCDSVQVWRGEADIFDAVQACCFHQLLRLFNVFGRKLDLWK